LTGYQPSALLCPISGRVRVGLFQTFHIHIIHYIVTLVNCFDYIATLSYGAVIVWRDTSQLSALLAFCGSPVAVGIGFYFWKSKAENIVKYAKTLGKKCGGLKMLICIVGAHIVRLRY
jgi:hypothetical protein